MRIDLKGEVNQSKHSNASFIEKAKVHHHDFRVEYDEEKPEKDISPILPDKESSFYQKLKQKRAFSPLGSEHEIEAQWPQMKSIVMDPGTPEPLDISGEKYDNDRLGTYYSSYIL